MEIVLVDMDDVLADFERYFLEKWREKYPDEPYVPLDSRVNFYTHEDYPEEYTEKIFEIKTAKGFYKNLPPIEGGIEATHYIAKHKDVRICTSPASNYENCVLEKYEWVDMHLGREFTKKIIITKDKTLVKGKYLIDDNPDIQGACKPEWEHIIFDRPYNKHVNKKRIILWKNYKEVLNL